MGPTSTASNDWKGKSRIVIVGGGLAGFATAIGARKAGFQVLVLEAAPQLFEVRRLLSHLDLCLLLLSS